MTDIEDAVNGLHDFFNVVLNNDGTLKNGAVSTAAIQDRAVTINKLAFLSNFYAVATGTGDAISVDFALPYTAAAPPVLPAGIVIYVKAKADNTGAATLNLDLNGALPVKKFTDAGIAALVAGNLKTDGIYEFVTDGTQWILTNPTPATPVPTGPQFIPKVSVHSGTGDLAWTDKDLSLSIPAGAKAAIFNCWSAWDDATDGWVIAKIRTSVTGDTYDLCEMGGIDGTRGRSQATFPITTTRHVEIQVTTTLPPKGLISIDLVGYYL